MKFLNTAAALLSTAVSVHAGCYSGGQLGDKSGVTDAVLHNYCTTWAGFLPTTQSKYTCHPVSPTQSYYLEIRCNKAEGCDIDPADLSGCVTGLSKEVNGCDYGGESDHGDWYYKADPNAVGCV